MGGISMLDRILIAAAIDSVDTGWAPLVLNR